MRKIQGSVEKNQSPKQPRNQQKETDGKCSPVSTVHDRIKSFPQMSSSISKKINCRNCGNFNSFSPAEKTTPIQQHLLMWAP